MYQKKIIKRSNTTLSKTTKHKIALKLDSTMISSKESSAFIKPDSDIKHYTNSLTIISNKQSSKQSLSKPKLKSLKSSLSLNRYTNCPPPSDTPTPTMPTLTPSIHISSIIGSKNPLSNSQPIPHSILNKENNNNELCLKESLSIISEIQKHFEASVNENKKPLTEIKKLITNTTQSLYDYIPLNDKEKKIITNDIMKSSDLRIENYHNAFYHIFYSLDKIKKTLNCIVNDNRGREKTNIKIKRKKVTIDEGENIIYNKRNDNMYNPMRDSTEVDVDVDDTDYCDKTMLENSQVQLPFNSSINSNEDSKMYKTNSTCFLSQSVSNSNKVLISPVSQIDFTTKCNSMMNNSFEYMDTLPDSLIVLSKTKSCQNEDCIIF